MKHNFIIILVANFIVAASTTMIMPFLSLYIDTLGEFSDSYVQTWAGLIFAATFITALIMSPIWGRIADKYGYKPIMIINCFGIATSIFNGLRTKCRAVFLTATRNGRCNRLYTNLNGIH